MASDNQRVVGEEDKAQALKLKDEGNSLFSQKQYGEALGKYAAAIALDATNAVLWTNNAACKLNLGRTPEAVEDAHKATQLDPNYGKGWARYAEALMKTGRWREAESAWERAISTLPSENLSDSEQKQLSIYKAGLNEVKSRPTAGPTRNGEDEKTSQYPWDRATSMLPQLEAAGVERSTSSAWVIAGAHLDFKNAMDLLGHVRQSGSDGAQTLHGKSGVLEKFVNAIMRDSRAFYRTESNFLDNMIKQMQVEAAQAKAWVDASPAEVIQRAHERENKEGWNSSRDAINTTARTWVTQAYVLVMVAKDPVGAVALYDNAIKLVDRGAEVWKDKPYGERASVLDVAFRRGVRVLWLNAYIMAYCLHRDSGTLVSERFQLDKLLNVAKQIIEDCTTNSDPPDIPGVRYDPGWVSSFWVYPEAQAHSVKAFYWKEIGWTQEEKGTDESKALVLDAFMKAAKAYEDAGASFPSDDEYRSYYLAFAVDCYWKVRTPMRVWWRLIPEMRSSSEKMRGIWEFSQLSYAGRDDAIEKVLAYADECQKKLDAGEIKEDDQIFPDFSLNI